MSDRLPLGEEIWVRRDHRGHGGLFYIREFGFYLCFTISIACLLIIFWINYARIGQPTIPWPLKLASIAMLIFLGFFLAKIYSTVLKTTSLCPVWFYGERLNPKKLIVFHLYHPPTVIFLADTHILKKRHRYKCYINLKITARDTDKSASLNMLTPEEYDRFMQYWNAAQRTSDE